MLRIIKILILLSTVHGSFLWVPEDVLLKCIFPRISPMCLFRMRLSCRYLAGPAQATMIALYTKTTDNEVVVHDIEKLSGFYLTLGEDEVEERAALRRLILASIPKPKDGKYQTIFQAYTSALFSTDLLQVPPIATQRFPELCRIILKHRQFVPLSELRKYKKSAVNEHKLWREEWQSDGEPIGVLADWKGWWCEGVYQCPHSLVLSGIKRMKNLPTCVQQALSQGLEPLLIRGKRLRHKKLILALLLTTQSNIKPAIALIQLTERQEIASIMPWMVLFGYPSVTSALLRAFPPADEATAAGLVVLMAANCVSLEIYTAVRGEDEYNLCRSYLESYDCDRGAFTAKKSRAISSRLLVEAALMLKCPYQVLESLIRRKKAFKSDLALLLVALARTSDPRVHLFLLEHIDPLIMHTLFAFLNDFHKFLRFPLSPLLVQSLLARPTRYSNTNMYRLNFRITFGVLMALTKDVSFELVSGALDEERGPILGWRLVEAVGQVWRSANPDLMYREIMQYAFKRRVFLPCFPASNNLHHLHPIDYTKYPLHSLVRSLPQSLCIYLLNPESPVMNPIRVILAQEGGFEALKKHFGGRLDFWISLLILKDDRLDFMALGASIAEHSKPGDIVIALRIFWKCRDLYADELYLFERAITAQLDLPGIYRFLAHFWSDKTWRALPLSSLPIIPQLSTQQLRQLIIHHPTHRACWDVYTLISNSAQHLNLIREHGLVSFMVSLLVVRRRVGSHAELMRTFPGLGSALHVTEPQEVDAWIEDIRAELKEWKKGQHISLFFD